LVAGKAQRKIENKTKLVEVFSWLYLVVPLIAVAML
jgi:hypothetical protein